MPETFRRPDDAWLGVFDERLEVFAGSALLRAR